MGRPAAEADTPSGRIAAEIRRRIATGALRPGQRVPSTRQITQEWGVAMATATRVLSVLRDEGLVRAVPGVGTVVAEQRAPSAPSGAGSAGRIRGESRRAREAEPELTREKVVRTAIEIADAEGLAAISMRRVAAELGAATMSLYRHVPGKDELVRLMTDAAFAEDVLPEDPPPGWRARLELAARLQWRIYRRHPWLAPVMSFTRPVLAYNTMAQTEWVMRAVAGLGFDSSDMLHIAITLAGYVRGTAANLEGEAEAEQETGITDEQWMESQDPAMMAIMASGAFPLLAGVPPRSLDLDTLFEFGLRRLLDGIGVLVEEKATPVERG